MCNIILGHDACYSLLSQIDDRDKFCETLTVCLSRNGRHTTFFLFYYWSKYNCFIDTCTILQHFQKIRRTHMYSLKSEIAANLDTISTLDAKWKFEKKGDSHFKSFYLYSRLEISFFFG